MQVEMQLKSLMKDILKFVLFSKIQNIRHCYCCLVFDLCVWLLGFFGPSLHTCILHCIRISQIHWILSIRIDWTWKRSMWLNFGLTKHFVQKLSKVVINELIKLGKLFDYCVWTRVVFWQGSVERCIFIKTYRKLQYFAKSY